MYVSRTEWCRLRSLLGLLAGLICLAPAAAAVEVDGRFGLGALGSYSFPGAYPSGAYDARLNADLRLDVDGLGGKPIGVAVDGDLYFDIDDLTFQTYRVLDLNLRLAPGRLRLKLGRQRAADTTEELVDGVGVRVDLGKGFALGGYGGLSPDPFDTLLSVSTGGAGAVIGFEAARFRAESVVGFSARASGLDHGFAHLSLMGMPAKPLSMFGRFKITGSGDRPGVGVADAFAGVTVKPFKILRIRGYYSGYSSERYVDLVERDPTLSRFASRAETMDLLTELPNDVLDGTFYHSLGADVALRDGARHGAVGARYRYRFAPDPDDHYLLAELNGGIVELGKGGADVIARGRFIHASGRDMGQAEIGLETPAFKRRLDLGTYLLFSGSPAIDDESRATIGIYGDVFASVWFGKGWSLAAAARLGWEDTPSASEVTIDGLLKVTKRFRPVTRPTAATE